MDTDVSLSSTDARSSCVILLASPNSEITTKYLPGIRFSAETVTGGSQPHIHARVLAHTIFCTQKRFYDRGLCKQFNILYIGRTGRGLSHCRGSVDAYCAFHDCTFTRLLHCQLKSVVCTTCRRNDGHAQVA